MFPDNSAATRLSNSGRRRPRMRSGAAGGEFRLRMGVFLAPWAFMRTKVLEMLRPLTAGDLQLILALVRSGTLAKAGKRLGVDQSTVFRSLQRLERGLGTVLFDRSQTGCRPTETAELLAQHAERIESEIEGAKLAVGSADGPAQGLVRISTTDVLLHGLVIPSLTQLARREPMLSYEVTASYELANLSKRDADIALRATKRPPEHMIGRSLGAITEAVFGSKLAWPSRKSFDLTQVKWVDLDDAIPNHPASKWRKRIAPNASLVLRATSIQTVFDSVVNGVGVAVLPVFMTRGRKDIIRLSEDIEECETHLWLLTHPESRGLKRVSIVFRHMAETISLE